MDFRHKYNICLFFVLFLVPYNLSAINPQNGGVSSCNETDILNFLNAMKIVNENFKGTVLEKLTIVNYNESSLYHPLKEKLLKANDIYSWALSDEISNTYKNYLYFNSASEIRFILQASSEDELLELIDKFINVFRNSSDIYTSIGIILTLDHDVRKEDVKQRLLDGAKKLLNFWIAPEFVSHYLTCNGPPFAIFNRHSENITMNNEIIDEFLSNFNYTKKPHKHKNYKFSTDDYDDNERKIIKCYTNYVLNKISIDVKVLLQKNLNFINSLKAGDKTRTNKSINFYYNQFMNEFNMMKNATNSQSFLEIFKNASNLTTPEVNFTETYFLPQNVEIVQFFCDISNPDFSFFLKTWIEPFKNLLKKKDKFYEIGSLLFLSDSEANCINTTKGLKLEVRGKVIKLSDIEKSQCFKDAQYFEVFATENVIIDIDLNMVGRKMLVTIIAPNWQIKGNRTINLDGYKAQNIESQAKNGSRYGYKNGAHGIAGLPGGPAGSFYGVANNIINAELLTIQANGGKGGKGQDGGNGAQGKDGETFTNLGDFNCKNQTVNGWKLIKDRSYSQESQVPSSFYHPAVIGKEGYRGGDGGNGGVGGLGGYGGYIKLLELSRNNTKLLSRISKLHGNSGDEGLGGLYGSGGRNGQTTRLSCECNILTLLNWRARFVGSIDSTEFGKSGQSGTNESTRNRQVPKIAHIVQNFPHTINQYKIFARSKLANPNYKTKQLHSFYQSLNTVKDITKQYDTLALIEEFTDLEAQYFSLQNQIHFTSSYTALQNRLIDYKEKPNYQREMNEEYKKVLEHLIRDINERIVHLHQNKTYYPVMINLHKWFNLNLVSLNTALHDQKAINDILINFNQKINPINDLIEEARHLINEDLSNAMRDLENTLDQNLDSILIEISDLKNKSFANEEELIKSRQKLQNIIILKGVFGVMQVACGVIAIINPGLGLATAVASAALATVESGVAEPDIKEQVSQVTKTFETLQSNAEKFLNKDEKKEDTLKLQEEYIKSAKQNVTTNFGVPIIDYVWNKIQNDTKKPLGVQNNTYDDLETYINKKKQGASKENEKDCKIAINAVKYLKVTNEVLKTVSSTATSILKSEDKIDEINKAIKANQKNYEKLQENEDKVYSDTKPMLDQMIGFVDKTEESMSTFNKNMLLITRWKVTNTIQNVQKNLKDTLNAFNATNSLTWTLEKVIHTFNVMNDMYQQILSYSDIKNDIKDIHSLTLQLPKYKGLLLTTDNHLTEALADLNTNLLYNAVQDSYDEWIPAFKQYTFPYGGRILENNMNPEILNYKNISDVVKIIEDNIFNFKKFMISKDNLGTRREVASIGNGNIIYPAFFVWSKKNYTEVIGDILSGKETKVHAHVTMNSLPALKFNQIQLLFTSSNPETQKNLSQILNHYSVYLTHEGDSTYRFKDKVFKIKTSPTQFIYRFLNNLSEYSESEFEPSVEYKKVVTSTKMLSPYATWTIQLKDDRIDGFKQLKEFIGKVDLELIGRGEYLEDIQCDQMCEDTMLKYYEKVNNI